MKREEVREIFPTATEEDIDRLLNKVGEELNPLKRTLKETEGARDDLKGQLEKAQTTSEGFKAKLDEVTKQLHAGLEENERLKALEQAAADREQEFLMRSAELEARSIFVGAGCFDADDIDSLVKQVSSTDMEVTKAGANALVSMVTKQREAVESATKAALLKSNPHITDPSGKPGVMSKKEFMALPYDKQVAMREANPNIISQLT